MLKLSHRPMDPCFPSRNIHTLLNSLLISSAMYLTIATFLVIFLFPETMQHVYLHLISSHLDKIGQMLALQEAVLTAERGDISLGCPKMAQLQAARAALIANKQQCQSLQMSAHRPPC